MTTCVICLEFGATWRHPGCVCHEARYHLRCLLQQAVTISVAKRCSICQEFYNITSNTTMEYEMGTIDDTEERSACTMIVLEHLNRLEQISRSDDTDIHVTMIHAAIFLHLFGKVIAMLPRTRYQTNRIQNGIIYIMTSMYLIHENSPNFPVNELRSVCEYRPSYQNMFERGVFRYIACHLIVAVEFVD